jgi:hypothetical protein
LDCGAFTPHCFAFGQGKTQRKRRKSAAVQKKAKHAAAASKLASSENPVKTIQFSSFAADKQMGGAQSAVLALVLLP